MQVLEQFMIGLGFKVDEKGAKQAQGVFDGLSKSALQLGGILASKMAIKKVVEDFRQAGTEMYNFQKISGVTAEKVDQIGYALQKNGGAAKDAFGFIKNIQNLIASPMTGNTGWMSEVARFGIDPNAILGAKNAEDAMLRLSDAFQGLTRTQQVQAGKALGFDDSQIRLMQQGRGAILGYMHASEDIGNMTQKQTEDAKAYDSAMQDLNKVLDSLGRDISSELTPAITELVTGFVDFYKANKDLIDSGIKEFFGEVADNLGLVATAMAVIGGLSGLKAVAVLRGALGLIAGGAGASAAGGAGAAAAAGAGIGIGTIAATGAAALLYSSSLNTGEDEAFRQYRMGDNTDGMVGILTKFFMDKGWTKEQAQGIVANLQTESNFDPNAVGDGGQAYGLAQWHPHRQADFKKLYGKDIRQSTLEEQAAFVDYELRQGTMKAAGDKLRDSKTAYDAGSVVSKYYEIPARRDEEADFRGARAQSYGQTVQDNRQYHIHTNDEQMVRRVLREEVNDMAVRTVGDFKSTQQ